MVAVVDNAGFTYRGEAEPAVTDLSFECRPGQMLAVLGPLGSGTSTLCRLVAGLLGETGTADGSIDIRGTVAMLGDDPESQLSGMTSRVGDEVQLPGRLHGADPATAEACARASLERLRIGHLWDRRLDTLSGGQRQLTALVSVLTLRPGLLILDQPSLSLDPEVRKMLGEVLRDYSDRGGSTLITSHQFDELTAVCDTVRFLADGRLSTPSPGGKLESRGIWDTRPASTGSAGGLTHGEGRDGQRAKSPLPLTIRGLCVMRDRTRVFSGIDLNLCAGQLTTIMGTNGAGKSTLLRALAGLLDSGAECTGTVMVDHLGAGGNLNGMSAHERAEHLGWVGQDPGIQLSASTVQSELMRAAPLPRHRRRDREQVLDRRRDDVDEAMKAAELSPVADVHPFDLDVPRRKDVVMASGLITGAPILLLDEPTIGRDLAGITRLNAFIRRFLHRGGAVLATTHDRRWAQENSQVVVELDAGRLERARRGAE